MNILHMWDQAGVACILLKFQRRYWFTKKLFKIK
jgi:hypothetical protein